MNADGVVVSVTPGEDFTRADAIDDVVLKRADGQVVHPFRRDVQPVEIVSRSGATRPVSQGAFYFRLDDVELPVTVVCVGHFGNFELVVNADDVIP